ncbi:uncharacterized protein LOC128395136 [Panonychus citri]|uniref:uncharacterized protein LOC128395136 n=1 Tax=Panonychus citri TaxID=50023 RepID=UPI002307E816|nr:uncharacterized protein LOC128395136 [Panonychus citri]
MGSIRNLNRRHRQQHENFQLFYINSLPDTQNHEFGVPDTESEDSTEIINFFPSDSSETSSMNLEDDTEKIVPTISEYCETLFETLISHIGLNLSQADNVFQLFKDLSKRYFSSNNHLPSLRYYWDKKALETNINIYILCEKDHSHGPLIGEPSNLQSYECEQELIQAVLKPGKFFLHLPLRQQIEKYIHNLPDYFWIEDDQRFDVSNCAEAKRVKEMGNLSQDKRYTLTLHADEVATGKSSSEKIFPIFITINEIKPEFRKKFFFLVGIFVGRKKPAVECYLGPVCDELLELSTFPTRISSNSRATFHLVGLIADAPMRAYLRCVRQYNHLNGCDWCLVTASSVGGARVYPNLTSEDQLNLMRKKDDFLTFSRIIEQDPDSEVLQNPRFRGLNGISPLLRLVDFDIVRGICVEPMHCISLGIFRNLISKGLVGADSLRHLERGFDRNSMRN